MPIAVGFDFDHTLGLDHGLEKNAFFALAECLGTSLERGDTAHTRLIDDVLARFRTNSISLEQAVGEFVASLVPNAITQETSVESFVAQYRQLCFERVANVTAIDGAQQLLDDLRAAGIPVAILTNGWSPLQEQKIARALDFDGPVLVSDAIGVIKPDPTAFIRLADELRVRAHEVLYVGDNPIADVGGAHAAGMRAVWFDWESIPYPSDMAPPDARVVSLEAVMDVVRGS